jgi:hypothetical protein
VYVRARPTKLAGSLVNDIRVVVVVAVSVGAVGFFEHAAPSNVNTTTDTKIARIREGIG